MKKFILYSLLVISLPFACIAQKSISSYDGRTFYKGDSVVIGRMDGNFYRSIKQLDDNSYRFVKESLAGNSFHILDIYAGDEKIFGRKADVLLIGTKGFFGKRYLLDVNRAIEKSEIKLAYSNGSVQSCVPLTDSLLFFIYHRHNETEPISIVDEYLARFRRSAYRQVREDEFALNKARKEGIAHLEKTLRAVDLTKTYCIGTELELGDYDFNNSSFPVELKGNYLAMINSTSLYARMNLLLSNIGNFDAVEVTEDSANAFVKKRKSSSGKVDRVTYGKVFFQVLPTDAANLIETEGKTVVATVTRVEVFESPTLEYNLLGIAKGE